MPEPLGQAPGSMVHQTRIPFDDPSGIRLHDWMGIDKSVFYDASKVAILPMGFCYPGKGTSGDLPPLPICAETRRRRLLDQMSNVEVTLIIGKYALGWHLPDNRKNLTETVRSWQWYDTGVFPLPHPSRRNNIWLKKNEWFESEVIAHLRSRVAAALRAEQLTNQAQP